MYSAPTIVLLVVSMLGTIACAWDPSNLDDMILDNDDGDEDNSLDEWQCDPAEKPIGNVYITMSPEIWTYGRQARFRRRGPWGSNRAGWGAWEDWRFYPSANPANQPSIIPRRFWGTDAAPFR